MSGKTSYSTLWQQIVVKEAENAKSHGLFTQSKHSARNLHEYIEFIENYIAKYSTQSLRNISPLIKDFADERVHIKSLKKCENHRIKGNDFYQRKLYDRSLIEYRTALQQAPNNSEQIALIYANISAVYLQRREFKNCLSAIQHALKNNYPPTKRNKLILRLKSLLKEAKCSEDLPASPSVNELLETITAISFTTEDSLDNSYPDCSPRYGPHKDLVNFSSACKLQYSTEKGRHIMIEDSFEPGDIFLVEQPFAWLLLKPYRSRYCYCCMKELGVPLPCCGCAEALFCSDNCSHNGWKTFHKYECKFMFLLNCIGVGHLSYKILILAGVEKIQFLSNREVASSPLVSDQEESGGYSAVWSLVNNWTQFSEEILFEYGLTAWLVVHILEAAEFLAPEDVEGRRSVMMAALHHLLQLQCNAHAITTVAEEMEEELNDDTNVSSVCQTRIASAIYPSASLLNHSCEPSAINSFHGTQLILRAQKSLAANQELFNCYGPHYLRHDWSERQSNLMDQYFFRCDCPHCLAQDATTSQLRAYRCSACGGELKKFNENLLKCESCLREEKLSDMEEKVSEADKLWREAAIESAGGVMDLSPLIECYNVRHSILYRHNRTLTMTMDSLAQSYWRSASDECGANKEMLQRSISLTKSTLESVAAIFGDSSVEYGWEALKLCEMFRAVGQSENKVRELCHLAFLAFQQNFGEFVAKSIFKHRQMNLSV